MRVPLACAFMLGVVGGSRSMLAPAAVTRAIRAGSVSVWRVRRSLSLEGRNLNHDSRRPGAGRNCSRQAADDSQPQKHAFALHSTRCHRRHLLARWWARLQNTLHWAPSSEWQVPMVGTEGGAAFRSWLSSLFERDLPAAVIEDLVTFALIGFVNSKLKTCASPSALA